MLTLDNNYDNIRLMVKDKYGQIILNENDLCDLLMKDPESTRIQSFVDKTINFDPELELDKSLVPDIFEYVDPNISIGEFDKIMQSEWFMPAEYQNMDIAAWVLDQCKTDVERQRVGKELLMYLDRDLFSLLKYLKYLVDTMRQNNIVWGVGRGSSVSSYVLFLIGIHKIDSIYFSLDIEEFLR